MRSATLAEVFEAVANARKNRQKVSLLIGAGCSVTAGIPVASGIVERIAELFPAKHAAAGSTENGAPPNYQQCMARLAPLERRQLMAEYVDKARINWAHVGIACLIQAGIVDRVLTVNFDPLIIRACALLNTFPGIYDFAASQMFDASHVADRAVFYLHGQQSGFVQLHTEEQVGRHAKRLTPVFENAGQGRLWLVVGYSGENDPVIANLAKKNSFANGLYWIARPGKAPPPSVVSNLLAPTKSSYLVECAGADEFFLQLAQHMTCFPPPIFATPFTHLESVYGTLVQEFPSLEAGEFAEGNKHPLEQPKVWIGEAIERFERTQTKEASEVSFVLKRYLAGDYEAITARYTNALNTVPPEVAENVSWSFILNGNALSEQAQAKKGAEAFQLFEKAGEKYAAALAIKPDKNEALNNWGNAVAAQAKTTKGAEADRLFEEAGARYAAALGIKPGSHQSLSNWGITLAEQAQTKKGPEADRLFEQAGEKYAAALALKPDKHESLHAWGNAMVAQAKTKEGAEADRLFKEAGEKYEAALALKPDKHETLNSWGNAIVAQASTKEGAEADRLFEEAGRKYSAALTIKPDRHEALNNWGIALADRARTKDGAEAGRLFEEAGEKYAAALAIKSDDHQALYNWGNALSDQARTKKDAEAEQLFEEAGEKYAATLALKPDKHEALNNWGNALADLARTKKGAEADRLFKEAKEKFAATLVIKPDDHVALHNWSISLRDEAKAKTGPEAERLLKLAKEKFAAARKIEDCTD
jgi:cytochrome c-type biogenesis protein CcmH/NrfG